ncbi:MAG: TrkA family potassium uptake protein [Oscillospiraceae bacterium]
MKTFLVIGLGRFGTAVATELCALGNEVLAMDVREEPVQAISNHVTHAVTADARDPEVLKSMSARNCDCAIVACGDDIGNSALITLNLKELGVKHVVAKARSHVHRKVLEKIGADRVIFPEHEMGAKLAHGLSSSNVLNFIELADGYSIVEIPVPVIWQGKTIQEINVRANFNVNIIAVHRIVPDEMHMAPGGDFTLLKNDVIVTLGQDKDTNRLQRL